MSTYPWIVAPAEFSTEKGVLKLLKSL